jgi:hypothetical protein
MKRPIAAWAALTVFVAVTPSAAQAQDKYSIQLKELGPGGTLRAESKATIVSKTQTQVEKEKQPGKATEEKTVTDLVFIESVLQRPVPDKMPTKIQRVYEKALQATIKDAAAADPKPQPYHAKTVVIEKKDAAYEFRIEGGEVFKDASLDEEFNGGQQETHKRLLFPAQPVPEGGTWKIDTAPLLRGFKKDEKVSVKKSEGTGKLVKVYKKDGRLFGVIESAFELEFTVEVKEVDPKSKGSLNSAQTLVMKATFDGCIDGTWAEGHIQARSEYSSNSVFRVPEAPAVTIISSGTTTGDRSWKEVAKK